jgi:hypothetical protein
MPTDDEILQAFRLIDARIDRSGSLAVLRERLAGELLGDADRVAATLAPDFELVSHTGGPAATVPASSIIESIRRQGESGALMWVELDHLLAEADLVAGEGVLRTYRSDEGTVTSFPLALFVRVPGDRMAHEVAYMRMDAAETVEVAAGAMPPADRLRSILG